jgi:hypothetical protein
MLEVFQKTTSFIVGLLIVVAAIMNECPRLAAISIGLLMMGLFTVPEAFWYLKDQLYRGKDDPGGDK